MKRVSFINGWSYRTLLLRRTVSGRQREDRKLRNRSPRIVRSSGRVVKVKFECLGVVPVKKAGDSKFSPN